MSGDDPFSGPLEGERTVIRPRPGARIPAGGTIPPPASPAAPDRGAPAAQPVRPAPPVSAANLDLAETGVNPLVTAAAPLLALAIRLRGTPVQADVEGLRQRIVREFHEFEARAAQAGVSQETIRVSRYALAATIDDLAQNTPWGGRNVWAQKSMVNVFARETFGGERFFDVLDRMRRDPARNLHVLELMYLCLSLGFEGQLRVIARGSSELNRIRDELYRTIRNQRGEFERDLAPHWRGLAAPHAPLRRFVPIWVIAASCAALLVVLFAVFSFLLASASDTVYAQIGDVPQVAAVAPPPRQPLPPPPPAGGALERLRAFLQPEIEAGLVEVYSEGQAVTVRIVDSGMFASGSADLVDRFEPLLRRIAEAVDEEPGRIIVTGHTDSVPIRKSLRFPSNHELSLARAEAVRQGIAERLDEPRRIVAEGRADTEPIADNATAEGRARNRRVEINLLR